MEVSHSNTEWLVWYISHDNIHESTHGSVPFKHRVVRLVCISHDNIHEINTWKCPIQTQRDYVIYIGISPMIIYIHEINTWKCPIQTQLQRGYVIISVYLP